MYWYYIHTGTNANDMYGEKAYIESHLENLHTMDKEQAHNHIRDVYARPKLDHSLQSGQYIEKINKLDWDISSKEFGSKEDFMREFGQYVGNSSNTAYTLTFGIISTKEARNMK
jgi:hypothetical protein